LVLVLVVGLASGKRKTAVDDAYLVEPDKISAFLHDHLRYRMSKSYVHIYGFCKPVCKSKYEIWESDLYVLTWHVPISCSCGTLG